jgi:YD repeat-containing protein
MSFLAMVEFGLLALEVTFGLRHFHSFTSPQTDEVGLELGNHGEDVEEQPPDRIGGIVDGPTQVEAHNGLGQLTSTTNGAGNNLAYGYDLDNEVTSITYPNTDVVGYTYDGAGEMTKVTDFAGHATTFAYSTTSSSSGPKMVTTYANGTTSTETAAPITMKAPCRLPVHPLGSATPATRMRTLRARP